MRHTTVCRRDGIHAGHARLDHMPDGRLAVGIPLRAVSPWHPRIDDWFVLTFCYIP